MLTLLKKLHNALMATLLVLIAAFLRKEIKLYYLSSQDFNSNILLLKRAAGPLIRLVEVTVVFEFMKDLRGDLEERARARMARRMKYGTLDQLKAMNKRLQLVLKNLPHLVETTEAKKKVRAAWVDEIQNNIMTDLTHRMEVVDAKLAAMPTRDETIESLKARKQAAQVQVERLLQVRADVASGRENAGGMDAAAAAVE